MSFEMSVWLFTSCCFTRLHAHQVVHHQTDEHSVRTREPAVGQPRLPLGNFEQESKEGMLDRVEEVLASQFTEHIVSCTDVCCVMVEHSNRNDEQTLSK